ncbi:hypothetical protein ACERNI_05980 [Camelimonas sp. ID_303_24]
MRKQTVAALAALATGLFVPVLPAPAQTGAPAALKNQELAPTAPVQSAPQAPAPQAPASKAPAPTLATPPAHGAAGSLTAPLPEPEQAEKQLRLSLSATLGSTPGQGLPLRSGLVWRIYADAPDPSGEIARPVAELTEATPTLQLKPGVYMVHAAYGYASAMQRIDLSSDSHVRLAINAGGLKVLGAIGDTPIPSSQMRVSVFVPVGQDLEGRRVVENAPPGVVIRLPEGVYHVVSTYGDSNAVMRSDLKVEPGKITEATLHHRAATMTLKLVQTPGGEAFAGTAFSVLTPGGDVIREEIGAFPSLVLAEGDYVVIARYDGKVHTREFKVESGANRDVEVLVSQ